MIRLENVVTVWRFIVSNREDYHSVLLGVEEAASSNLVVPTILRAISLSGVSSASLPPPLFLSPRQARVLKVGLYT